MDKKYCIFDMDGTITDSMRIWRSLGEEYLISKGITEGIDTVRERVRRLTLLQTGEVLMRDYGLPGPAESIGDEINSMMEAHYHNDVPLKEGVDDYIRSLRAGGARLAVATATEERLARSCLTRLRVAGEFDYILSCETRGVGKTEPDIYLEAAALLGAPPQDIAVYEDALYAAETAKAAGFYLVAVYDGTSADDWPRLCELADETIFDWRSAK